MVADRIAKVFDLNDAHWNGLATDFYLQSVTPTWWLTRESHQRSLIGGFQKKREASEAEMGLAPVYINELPHSAFFLFLLSILPCTIDPEYDYGEATVSILVVFYTLMFITTLVPDSSLNQIPRYESR